MVRARVAAAAGLLAVLVGAGCGDDDEPAAEQTASTGAVTTASPPTTSTDSVDDTTAATAPVTDDEGTTGTDDEGTTGTDDEGSAAPSMPSADGMPTVSFEDDGTPVVSIPDAAPPAETQQVELRAGDGPEVTDGDVVTLDAQMVHWETGDVLDQTWGREPFEFTTTGGISRIRDAIIGQPVGSEILLVLPPEDGAEANGQPSRGVEDDDTLVFVISIVDTGQP